MDPQIIYGAKQFTATSGNRVVHITDLGPDGMHAAWDLKPSDEDMEELEKWVAARARATGVTRHNGGRAEAQRAYKEWEKKG